MTIRPPHIWWNICAFPHILGKPFLIFDFAPDPIWISCVWGKFCFLFYVWRIMGRETNWLLYTDYRMVSSFSLLWGTLYSRVRSTRFGSGSKLYTCYHLTNGFCWISILIPFCKACSALKHPFAFALQNLADCQSTVCYSIRSKILNRLHSHNQWGPRLEGWSYTAARLANWRRVTQQGVAFYVMDGPCRLPWRTTPLALVWGWSITKCTQNTVMSYVMPGGRHGLVL